MRSCDWGKVGWGGGDGSWSSYASVDLKTGRGSCGICGWLILSFISITTLILYYPFVPPHNFLYPFCQYCPHHAHDNHTLLVSRSFQANLTPEMCKFVEIIKYLFFSVHFVEEKTFNSRLEICLQMSTKTSQNAPKVVYFIRYFLGGMPPDHPSICSRLF